MKQSYLTVTDQFCGAGGSSIGATAAGMELRLALNHWALAIETHNSNFPNAAHDCTDISACDPRRYPSTDMLITSPECTNHSIAKGKSKRPQYQPDLFGEVKIDPAEERSRATMWDVPRFAEYHKYNIIIVENVVDARSWVLWDAWLHAMSLLGYDHQCVYFNSMFAWPTPQSRDRMYVVFWKKGNTAPNLDFRPLAHCPQCARNVEAVQVWRNPHKRFGRYGRRNQYIYCCPTCHDEITPYYYCAANAIDWSLPAQRIGDRPRPLKDKTLNRIRIGLEKFGREPHMVDFVHSGHDPSKMRPVGRPWPTQIACVCHGLVQQFVVELNYGGDRQPVAVERPIPTQTGRQSQGLVVPPYLVDLRGENAPKELIEALSTICASGNHHGLVVPFLLSYYTRNSGLGAAVSGVEEPVPTVPTWAVHYVAQPGQTPAVEDCGFRMLQPHEIQAAMGFPGNYTVLGDGRAKVKQLGNAVTPPVMEMLIKRCVATLR